MNAGPSTARITDFDSENLLSKIEPVKTENEDRFSDAASIPERIVQNTGFSKMKRFLDDSARIEVYKIA